MNGEAHDHASYAQSHSRWLIDNTALTFDQIALFCGLHPLEVKGIANGDVAQGIKGMDPIAGQLTRSEIERCQEDPTSELQIADSKREIPAGKPRKTTKYTPLSKRQERPDAIAWLVRNHAELRDSEISRLVGTTKPTIQSIRDRSHWNISNITPTDPVTLGLCTQIELDEIVAKAALREQRRLAKLAKEQGNTGEVLKDAAETTAMEPRRMLTRLPAAAVIWAAPPSRLNRIRGGRHHLGAAQSRRFAPEDVFGTNPAAAIFPFAA